MVRYENWPNELNMALNSLKEIFTNAQPLWRPSGGRGVYGGTIMAQCLSAAQETIEYSLIISNMHCFFLLAAEADTPISYRVMFGG